MWSGDCCYRLGFCCFPRVLGCLFCPPPPTTTSHTQGRLRGRCPRSWCHKSLPRFSAIHSLRSPSISRSYSYCRRWYVDTKLIALPSIKVWLARGGPECPTLERGLNRVEFVETNTWPFLSLFLEYSEYLELTIHELSNRPRFVFSVWYNI